MTRRAILMAAMVTAASALTAAVGGAQPTAAPASQPATTQPALTLYASVAAQGGRAYTGRVVDDLPVIQGIHVKYVRIMSGFAKAANASICVDFEEPRPNPSYGIATTKDVSKLAELDAFVRTVTNLMNDAREQSGIERDQTGPRRRLVGLYSGLPMGMGWQYGEDMNKYAADNRRVAAADPLRAADFMAVHIYVHQDDIKTTTPASAKIYARKRIEAARLYNKPIILFVMAVWEQSSPPIDVPDEILQALMSVARDERLDVCIWNSGLKPAEATRQVRRVRAAAEAVGYR